MDSARIAAATAEGYADGLADGRAERVPVVTDEMVERAAAAYEIGGVCRPYGKCGGGCRTALGHRMHLAVLAALETPDA